jgi:hypothetical protein
MYNVYNFINAGVTGTQMAWEDADQVSFVVLQYSHRQALARAA